MKKIIGCIAFIISTISMFPQAPYTTSYQSIIRDANNGLIANETIGMKISILQGSTNGDIVYSEIHDTESNQNGLISVEIGNGEVVDGDYLFIDWPNGPYFIKTEVDPEGGTNYTITGVSELLSVPYAMHAKTAENISGGITETDPLFNASVASGITISDTASWNNKLESYTETQALSDVISLNNSANNSNITNLADPINAQDAATKAYVDLLLERIYELEAINAVATIEDTEGNSYKIVKIGEQYWMAENLRSTKYNDGTNIPLVTDSIEWASMTTPAYCWYNNDSINHAETYGALYNFYTVETAKLCPIGWHIPTPEEWNELKIYLGDWQVAGGKLKETGILHWKSPNEGATNETKFTALPSGWRNYAGAFDKITENACLWASFLNSSYAPLAFLNNSNAYLILASTNNKEVGVSVRCVKD